MGLRDVFTWIGAKPDKRAEELNAQILSLFEKELGKSLERAWEKGFNQGVESVTKLPKTYDKTG